MPSHPCGMAPQLPLPAALCSERHGSPGSGTGRFWHTVYMVRKLYYPKRCSIRILTWHEISYLALQKSESQSITCKLHHMIITCYFTKYDLQFNNRLERTKAHKYWILDLHHPKEIACLKAVFFFTMWSQTEVENRLFSTASFSNTISKINW